MGSLIGTRFHNIHKRRFIRRLKGKGVKKIQTIPQPAPYDLLIDKDVRVGLRFAGVGARRHRIFHQLSKGPRIYHYRYQTWNFNFHRHGQMIEGVDFVICVVVNTKDYFCIPLGEISGKTFSLHGSKRNREYGGRYAKYRNTIVPIHALIRERAKDRRQSAAHHTKAA